VADFALNSLAVLLIAVEKVAPQHVPGVLNCTTTIPGYGDNGSPNAGFPRATTSTFAFDGMPALTREKVVKIGAKVISHSRYLVFQMAEVAVPRELFGHLLDRIAKLRPRDPGPC
jgi:hypothetical protein